MTTPTTARPTPPQGDASAIVTELMAEIRENRKAPPPPRRLPPWVRATGATVGMAVCAWLWIAPPSWILPPPLPPVTSQQRESSARLAIVLQASRVDAYRTRTGRLPANTVEAGINYPEISYQRLDSATYQLSMDPGSGRITYRSTEPRDRFLASSEAKTLGGGKP